MPDTRPNPYVGPRAFEEAEENRFFGREREREKLYHLLLARRLVLLHAPSGAGKSSLVRAGLIPRLRQKGFFVRPVIRVGAEAAAGLGANRFRMATLLSLDESQQLKAEELVSLSLDAYLERNPPPDDGEEVLIFDQFEELLSVDPADRAAKEAFVAELGTLLENPRRWALFVLREDYLGALKPLLLPIPTRLAATFRLDLLDPEQARQAIQGPARAMGGEVDAAATDKLIDDLRQTSVQRPDGSSEVVLGQAIEPVHIQVVCQRLWDLQPTHQITVTDIVQIGDVDSALRGYYDKQVATTAAVSEVSERAIRDWIGEQLITEGGLRGQVLRQPDSTAGLTNAAIRRLVDAHLVRAEERRGAIWYELAHDRLIGPVRQDNAAWFEANLSTLQRQARLWERADRPDGLLLRGDALASEMRYLQTNETKLTSIEQDFLMACQNAQVVAEREHHRNQLVRWLAGGALFGLVLVLILAVAAFVLYGQANSNLARAENQRATAEAAQMMAETSQSLAESQRATAEAARVKTARQLLISNAQNLLERDPNQVLALLLAVPRAEHIESWTPLLLTQAVHQASIRSFSGHSNGIGSVAFSPDGKTALSGSGDTTLRLWDVATGQTIRIFSGHTGWVWSVAFSSDGKTALSGSSDFTLRLWDVATGQTIRVFSGHTGWVRSVVFSSDGKTALSGSDDSTLRLWDVATGQTIRVLSGHKATIWSAAFSPDSKTAISGSDDKTLRLWNVATGQTIRVFSGHTAPIRSTAFSPDGKTVLSGSGDYTLRLWNVTTGQAIRTFSDHSAGVWSVAFSSDGKTVLSGSNDKTLRLWDVATGQPIRTFNGHSAPVQSVIISPDGRTALSGSDDRTLRLWDIATGQPICTFSGHSAPVWRVAFSPDGKTALSGSSDTTLRLWDVATGESIRIFRGSSTMAGSVAFSPDGKTALSDSGDSTLRLWDVATGQPIRTFSGHSAPVWSVAFSPDGKTALSGSADTTLRLWDVATGQPMRTFSGHSAAIRSVAFSPDGTTALSGSDDFTLRLWDVTTGQSIRTFSGHSAGVWSVAFSPYGGMVLSGSDDSTLRLWDISNGQSLHIFLGHTDSVNGTAFSPDGKTVLSGSDDSTLRLWKIETDANLLDWIPTHRYLPALTHDQRQRYLLPVAP